MVMEMISLLTLVMIKIATSLQRGHLRSRVSLPLQRLGVLAALQILTLGKRGQESNRGIKLFNIQPDDKLIVQFNAKGRPICENARPVATLCRIIVRTPGNAPLHVTKWVDVPEQAKEKMWKHIQDYAVADDERKKWVRNDFSTDPLTFLVKIGPGLCNIGAIHRFKLWLRKIRPIVVAKHLNIQGGLRVLLDIEIRRLGAGLMEVYLLERISSFAPIVGRTGLMLMRNQQKTFQSLRN
ncbi:hypothetical protein MRB53_016825 [Persea americana]|uniref:Uncharacterized protein n=1 Tax=Persea americana TaxID=3435 RepID=A0ACC2M474_PERAE|nr:hypothetical protein MRB53_016825 [Persea americana]